MLYTFALHFTMDVFLFILFYSLLYISYSANLVSLPLTERQFLKNLAE